MTARRTVRRVVCILVCVNVVMFVQQMMPTTVHIDFTINKPSLFDINSLSYFSRSLLFSEASSAKISKIIHITWKDQTLPKPTVEWVKQWGTYAHGWRYIFWTDEAARRLVQLKFPEHLNLYDSYPKSIYRADAMRYFILYEYGGVYADIDVEPLNDFEPLRDQYDCVLSQEPDEHAKLLNDVFGDDQHRIACNAFMACRPKHPFFYSVIRNLQHHHNISQRFHHEAGRTILSTGPGMLTNMFSIYSANAKKHVKSHPGDGIHLAPSWEFTPIFDPIQVEYMRFKCKKHYHLMPDFKKRVCSDLKARNWENVPRSNSYCTHHWFHSWLSGAEGAAGRNQGFSELSLENILPGIVIADHLPELQ